LPAAVDVGNDGGNFGYDGADCGCNVDVKG
jgi:hypothetical protein